MKTTIFIIQDGDPPPTPPASWKPFMAVIASRASEAFLNWTKAKPCEPCSGTKTFQADLNEACGSGDIPPKYGLIYMVRLRTSINWILEISHWMWLNPGPETMSGLIDWYLRKNCSIVSLHILLMAHLAFVGVRISVQVDELNLTWVSALKHSATCRAADCLICTWIMLVKQS